MELDKNAVSYIIKQELYEPDDVFHKRSWFIVNLNPKTPDEFEEYTKYSKLWVNVHYNNCKYNNVQSIISK